MFKIERSRNDLATRFHEFEDEGEHYCHSHTDFMLYDDPSCGDLSLEFYNYPSRAFTDETCNYDVNHKHRRNNKDDTF